MSEALATPAQNANTLPVNTENLVAKSFDETAAAKFVTGIDFLVRIQLCGSSTNLCKEGKIAVGNYALIKNKNEFVDLGKSLNVWVCALRMKALAFGDDPVTVYYDPKTPEFQDIVRRAEADKQNSGCMAGFEFLLYIPDKRTYATFFLSSASARNEAPSLKALITKTATLSSALAENKKKQKWHVPKALTCSVPLAPPDMEEFASVTSRFVNAMPSSVKKADAAKVGVDADRPQ